MLNVFLVYNVFIMMGPNRPPRPPIEGMMKDVIKERVLELVPSASRREQMFQKSIGQLDDQLIITKTDAEAVLATMQSMEPNAKNAIYINALRVLLKAIDDTAEAKRKL